MDLWKNIDKIVALFKQNSVKILLLDFDGTLAPIAESPQEAKLSLETRKLLRELSKKKGVYLAIISGRKLDDIKTKIGIQNIIYGGNHGFEGEILGEKYFFPVPQKMLLALKKIREEINKETEQYKGVFVEDKGLTLSFHFRLADKQHLLIVKSIFKQIIKPYIEKRLISCIEGKMIFDIRPNVNWDKGSFAKLVFNRIYLQIKTSPLVVFIGDDKTDEDVFRIVEEGITIKVGGGYRSNAQYRLSNTGDVLKFLEWVANNLK